MTTTQTIRLQGIGHVSAKPAADLKAGDVTVWNYGHAHEVLSVESVSPAFVVVHMIKEQGAPGVWTRRMKRDRLVGIQPGVVGPYASSRTE